MTGPTCQLGSRYSWLLPLALAAPTRIWLAALSSGCPWPRLSGTAKRWPR